MPTDSHNIRLGPEWAIGLGRAPEASSATLAAVIRALVRAYCAGEVDDVVARWLSADAEEYTGADTLTSPEGDGPQTAHLPLA